MYKKLLLFLLSLLLINNIVAADVELDAHVYSQYTIFNYIFTFNENETIGKFSFEKPKDATVDYIVDQNGPIQYEVAGDYLILKPDEVSDNVILLRLKSKTLSAEIEKTESFRTYQNFNFNVENFEFEIILKENFGEILNVFPDNYSLTNNEKVFWKETVLEKNSLYVVNFKEEVVEETSGNYSEYYVVGIGFTILVLFVIILFFIYPRYLKKYLRKERKNLEKKDVTGKEIKFEKSKKKNDESLLKKKEVVKVENKFEEIIEKHLTENEKSVVQLIKETPGISQNEILDYLPSLTKSNLSKIISKLHAKRILKRIRVGKVNNIYLGDKLEPQESNDEKISEEEEY